MLPPTVKTITLRMGAALATTMAATPNFRPWFFAVAIIPAAG